MLPPANAAGRAMTARRLRSGVSLGRLGTSRKPAFAAARQTNASCTMPPMGTAHVSAHPVDRPNEGAASIAPISTTFKATGAAAAAANRPVAFSTPDSSAASEISRMYGKQTRLNAVASSSRPSSAKPAAMANTNQGMMAWASNVSTISTPARPEKASRANSSAPSLRSSLRENIGTNAVLKAPSAKNLRNMLGKAKATRKASATGPSPKREAIRMSRAKPNTRDTSVHAPTVRNPKMSRIGFKLYPRARSAPASMASRSFRSITVCFAREWILSPNMSLT